LGIYALQSFAWLKSLASDLVCLALELAYGQEPDLVLAVELGYTFQTLVVSFRTWLHTPDLDLASYLDSRTWLRA